jgi:hypothetical protein
MNYLGYISCDINTLNILNQVYPWVPNENTIRPSEKVLEKKAAFIKKLDLRNILLRDDIISTLFNDNTNQKLFLPNPFPYNITGNHYVMWYYKYNIVGGIGIQNMIQDINIDIINGIYNIVEHYEFNFAWYENPKMSVNDAENNELYHVQVFWVSTDDL